MWDAQIVAPLGRLTWRKFLTIALSFLVAIFAYLAVFTSTAHAADTAKWVSGELSYQNNTYSGPDTAKSGDGYDLPDGSIIYRYLETGIPQKVHILYFPSGTDPTKATDATNITYTRGPTGGFSGKSDPQTVSIDTASQAQATQKPNGGGGASGGSCKVTGGLAWIICPLTTTLASVMDWVFNVIVSYLEVQPLLTTSTDNVIMSTWNIMRNFANVAFVIAFIIIIYSQLTSMGISNYSIKKMLPRLIIAAILMNVSYWICAIGIDLSNITGHALYDLFIWLRNMIGDMKDVKGWQFVDWQSFVTFAMAGGGAAIGGTALWISLAAKLGAFSVTGVVMMILPILVMLFLIILVVMLILAARQAIIILLVMVSPLAFVAYLLPNTEKWFEKWREAFVAMLIFFPAFSLVFGGSQLAGFAIIKTATSINMVILGLAVQVAPLAITPLIMKLSNGVLARVAGVINNPRKGLVDRTRNWANDRLDANRAYQMSKTRQMQNAGKLGRRHVMRRTALHHDNEHRMRTGLKAVSEEMGTSLFNDSPEGRELATAQHISTGIKDRIGNEVKTAIQTEVNMQGTELHANTVRLERSKVELEGQQGITTAMMKEYEEHRTTAPAALASDIRALRASHEQVALNGMRKKSADDAVTKQFSKDFLASSAMQAEAGGIGGHEAADVALAAHMSAQLEAYNKNVAAARAINSHFKLTVKEKADLAMGRAIAPKTDSAGNTRSFTAADTFIREASIEDTIKAAPYGFGYEVIKNSGRADFADYRLTIAAAMEAANWEGRATFMDGEFRDELKQGNVSEALIKEKAAEFLVNGKFSPEKMVGNHKNSLNTFLSVAEELKNGTFTVDNSKYADKFKDAAGHGQLDKALHAISKNADFVLSDVRFKGRVGDDQKDPLAKMEVKLK